MFKVRGSFFFQAEDGIRDLTVTWSSDVCSSDLDLYRQTHAAAYLELARAIGNNIVKQYYHHGYFTPYEDTIFANINAIEPYALLALDAAKIGRASCRERV